WGVSSGVAALAVATVPLFTLLFSQLFGQRNTTLEWGGIVLGLFGIVLLNLGSNLQASPAGAGSTPSRRPRTRQRTGSGRRR
ncbi:EamA family transporter, partial [Pseudomonas aeruginosa]